MYMFSYTLATRTWNADSIQDCYLKLTLKVSLPPRGQKLITKAFNCIHTEIGWKKEFLRNDKILSHIIHQAFSFTHTQTHPVHTIHMKNSFSLKHIQIQIIFRFIWLMKQRRLTLNAETKACHWNILTTWYRQGRSGLQFIYHMMWTCHLAWAC